MRRRLVGSLVVLGLAAACGGRSSPAAPSNPPSGPRQADSPDVPVVTSILPAAAAAGSGEITVTITGSRFISTSPIAALVRWTTAAGSPTYLATRFVSSTEVIASVPASLLTTEGTAQIAVVNGDLMGITDGFTRYPTSNLVTFTIIASEPNRIPGPTWLAEHMMRSSNSPEPVDIAPLKPVRPFPDSRARP